MSFLFGQGPDTQTQYNLEQAAQQGIAGANPNVQTVKFGPSAAATGALPAAISGYQSLINSPSGFAPQEQAILTGAEQGANARTAAAVNEQQEMAERKGMGSSGEAEAEKAIAEGAGAGGLAAAGTQAAGVGSEARLAALGGEAGAGGEQARLEDTTQLASEENQQKMLQQQFINALTKAYGNQGLMTAYNGTKAGGGYGLMASGLLGSVLGQGAASAMTGGATSAGQSLIDQLGSMGGGSGLGGAGDASAANLGTNDNSLLASLYGGYG